jgi:hypothetical protein
LFFVMLALLIAGPFWSLLIALQAGWWVYRASDTRHLLPRGLGVTVWVASYVTAWRYDILKMHELYAELPLVPPDCYIATAAARGHPAFVHASPLRLADGKIIRVNCQLQIFKSAELAMMALAPRLHAILRRMYDAIGKPLAGGIRHPLLADAAYLSLKPAEWLAKFLLKVIIPDVNSTSIYN